MYDVPYNVKRALRLGNLRKNYKIVVHGMTAPGLSERFYFNGASGIMMYYVEETAEYIFSGGEHEPDPSGEPVTTTDYIFTYASPTGSAHDTLHVSPNTKMTLLEGYTLTFTGSSGVGPYDPYPSIWRNYEDYRDIADGSFTMDNNDLISESVKLDDRMCSGKYLKFGLCEGASLEFQYYNRPNINGKEIQAYVSVEYLDDDNQLAWYDIPLGWFTVDECPMQFSTGIYKAVAFNKLKSEYLDQKANALLIDSVTDPTQAISFGDIRHLLLQDYEIKEEYKSEETLTDDGSIYVYRIGPATTLKARYGINTYFNYMWLARGVLSYYYPMLECVRWRVDLETGKSYILQLERDVSAAEKHLFEFVRDIIQDAITASTVETWLHSNYAAPSTASTNVAYNGWGSACYIGYYHNGTLDRYSTVGKTANEAGVLGTFEDLAGRTIVGANGDYLELCWPMYVRMASNTSGGGDPRYDSFSLMTYEMDAYDVPAGPHWYRYYADASQSLDNAPWQWLDYRYPNGEPTNLLDYEECLPAPSGYYELLRSFTIDTTAADDVQIIPADLSDITLREATSAVYELSAQFGQLDRVTDLFSGVELNHGGLYPAETLYPADGLYPDQGGSNNVIHPFPSEYQKLWTDTVGLQSFRYLIITYKGLVDDGQGNTTEADLVLQRTVNTHGTTDYNMSDNWLFRNMVWTEQQVGDFADAMVAKMQDVRWFPFEMWAAGLPYVDVGDAIEIADRAGNTYMSYILQRQLNGIHNLQDTYINGELDVF